MNARSNIMHRIRTALRQPAPRPEIPSGRTAFSTISNPNLLAHFERELLALRTGFHCAPNWKDARTWCRLITDQHELRRIVATPDADVLDACQSVPIQTPRKNEDCGPKLADIDLSVTTCDCLVALTGSIVLTARSGFGRALSVLPPAHLVVARRSQLLPDFTEAFQLLYARYGKSWPSMLTIITGPSRTSDIEKILVLGAHGPRKLFVLLLDF